MRPATNTAAAAAMAGIIAATSLAAETTLPFDEPTQQVQQQTPETKPIKRQPRSRGNRTRLARDWTLPIDWRSQVKEKFGVSDQFIDREADRFHRYWISPDANKPLKADWQGTWVNWIDRAQQRGGSPDLLQTQQTAYRNGHYVGASL
mgnify:CR=1 FL=1